MIWCDCVVYEVNETCVVYVYCVLLGDVCMVHVWHALYVYCMGCVSVMNLVCVL